MCIDAPESMRNSLSSGLILERARKQRKKKVNLCFFFSFRLFLANLHVASRAHRYYNSVSSWDQSSDFGALGLRWLGLPGQIIPCDGSSSRMSAWRSTAAVNWTHGIGFNMVDLFRKMDEFFGGSMSKDTQPLCRVSFNIATAPLLLGCSSTRRCAQALFGLVEWTLWSMPLFT